MAHLAYKFGSYYGVFSSNGKKKWIRIGRVGKPEAKKILKRLEASTLHILSLRRGERSASIVS